MYDVVPAIEGHGVGRILAEHLPAVFGDRADKLRHRLGGDPVHLLLRRGEGPPVLDGFVVDVVFIDFDVDILDHVEPLREYRVHGGSLAGLPHLRRRGSLSPEPLHLILIWNSGAAPSGVPRGGEPF